MVINLLAKNSSTLTFGRWLVLIEISLEYVRFPGLWFNYFVCYHETPESQSNFCFQKIYIYDIKTLPTPKKKAQSFRLWRYTRWWFQRFMFDHYLGKNDPNWRAYFSDGWLLKHQLYIIQGISFAVFSNSPFPGSKHGLVGFLFGVDFKTPHLDVPGS